MLAVLLTLSSVVAASAAPRSSEVPAHGVVSQQEGGQPTSDHGIAGSGANTERILWSILAIALAVPIAGTLYLLKRRLRAFPEHPEWVAPISVMRSRDLPDERTVESGEPSHNAHAHH